MLQRALCSPCAWWVKALLFPACSTTRMATFGTLLIRCTASFIRLIISSLSIASIFGIQSNITIEGYCSQMSSMIYSSFPLPENPRLIKGSSNFRPTIFAQSIAGREAHAPWAIEVPYRTMGLSLTAGTKEKLHSSGTPISRHSSR